ncbi:MAG: S41 family peptidase [Bacteroidales bacterium]
MKKNTYLPIIFALIFIAGIYVARLGINTNSSETATLNDKTKLESILNIIKTEYVDSINIKTLVEKVIPEITKKLDPHTTYIPNKEYANISEPIHGEFDGIGVQFNIVKDTVIIVQVIPGGPSEKIGIHAGDKIIAVEDSSITNIGITNTNVMNLLKGPKGTEVTISVIRNGHKSPLDFTIVRDKIPLHSIDASYMLSDSVGYMKISRFAQTTPDEFITHVTKLKNKHMSSLIIDLRENGGGLLHAAIFIANEFLPEKDLILYTKGKNYPRENYYADGTGTCKNINVNILINEYSASASEIIAGAIQDNDRGTIIGRRSFGKGLVNRDFMFADSSVLRLTIQKFYTPSGRSIQKPFNNGRESYNDELLQRAIHKELSEKDSIHFPDSLQYKTKNGRIVYGGGGIMPDIFVPIDTSLNTDLYVSLISQNILYNAALSYANTNRKQLKNMNYNTIISHIQNSEILELVKQEAQAQDITYSHENFTEIHEDILRITTAYIVRTIHDEEYFYRVYQKNDKTIQTALNEFQN